MFLSRIPSNYILIRRHPPSQIWKMLPLHTKETNFQRSPFFDANDVLVECVDSQPFYRPVARKYEYPGRPEHTIEEIYKWVRSNMNQDGIAFRQNDVFVSTEEAKMLLWGSDLPDQVSSPFTIFLLHCKIPYCDSKWYMNKFLMLFLLCRVLMHWCYFYSKEKVRTMVIVSMYLHI